MARIHICKSTCQALSSQMVHLALLVGSNELRPSAMWIVPASFFRCSTPWSIHDKGLVEPKYSKLVKGVLWHFPKWPMKWADPFEPDRSQRISLLPLLAISHGSDRETDGIGNILIIYLIHQSNGYTTNIDGLNYRPSSLHSNDQSLR